MMIDLQPREPFHPLFGAMPETPLMIELQQTMEYLGFATHLAYVGPLFDEMLDAETVAYVIAGAAQWHDLSGMAGVANIGRNREWAAQTFGDDPVVIDAVTDMLMRSREAVFDYTGPLGLAHLLPPGIITDPGHGYPNFSARNGTRSIITVPTGTASASTAPAPAATRSRNMRRHLERSIPTQRLPHRNYSCGSIICRGNFGCLAALPCGGSRCGAMIAGHHGKRHAPRLVHAQTAH